MKNSEKYFFNDFTLANYRKLIIEAKKAYKFYDFFNFNLDTNFIILRHDVDGSMHRAFKMASIESELGVKATYFLLLHSEFYNLFEKDISNLVKKIRDLGHDIGLHFDSHFYEILDENVLEEKLLFEKDIIEKLFSIEVKSFCFHVTSNFTLSCNKEEYAGMKNVFSFFFQKKIGYSSDSNGHWRFDRLYDLIENNTHKQLQINTHPEWWQDESMSPKKRIQRCIDYRALNTLKIYQDNLDQTGRLNIDDI